MNVIRLCAILGLLLSVGLSPASAQSSTTYAAPNMWGTVPSGVSVPGALDSSSLHYQNGAAAGQVNAARSGVLLGTGGSSTINAIGSQAIVSNTIYGNGNTTTITASQSSSNTAAVSNAGQIGQTNTGNTNQ